jgi:hypothetical protein
MRFILLSVPAANLAYFPIIQESVPPSISSTWRVLRRAWLRMSVRKRRSAYSALS